MLNNGDTHEMELIATRESGAEEWLCPTCGRRFMMQWPPNYKRIVLEEGDANAVHSGGKGGARLLAAELREQEEVSLSEEMRAALEELDFGDEDLARTNGKSGLSSDLLDALEELDFDGWDDGKQ